LHGWRGARKLGLPHSITETWTTMARSDPPQAGRLQRELRYLGLIAGFGLILLPFLVYLAGVTTLGPYDGGLAAFLGSLYGSLIRLEPGAWVLLLAGPYALFWVLRLLTRPLRRPRAPA
jgi:hypothetical protein